MPSISIDTFFACSLMVSVVIIATVLSAGILTAHIDSFQDLNEEEYFRAISAYIVSSPGTPADWGPNKTSIPSALGLAKNDSTFPSELDIDKVCRLNGQNAFALTYPEILKATGLNTFALGISVSQLMTISVTLSSSDTSENSTVYGFTIHASQGGTPVPASLHCYVVARDFLSDIYNTTSTAGTAYIDVDIPNASGGAASFIVFGRATYDPRITACTVYSFGHMSAKPLPQRTFLDLSPLNHTLYLDLNSNNITLEQCYAFSYKYRFDLTSTSNTTYAIPTISETSPTVLLVSGSNASTYFTEWTTYPQIPFQAGANFQNSECHSFSYIVTIERTLYKLTLHFGGISK